MRLDPEWLQTQGEDTRLLYWVDTAFPFDPPDRIGVAVSGGGDSLALLHLLKRWSDQTGQPITAVTVDHNLREGSRAEAEHVAALCADWGIAHDILTWDGWDGQGNLQSKAREARYRLMGQWALANGVDAIVLGHTQTDVAETFLMRLARKAGIDGLAAMDKNFEKEGLRWSRPLIHENRAYLRDYLRHHKITWMDDPSNSDPRFARVQAREVLKALAPLGIDEEAIGQAAHNIWIGKSALETYTSELAQTHVAVDAGVLTLRRRPPLPVEIERRLLVEALKWVGRLEYPPRAATLGEIELALITGEKTAACGCIILSKKRDLVMFRELQAVKSLVGPTTALWDGLWSLDGPHDPAFQIRALGEAVQQCPDWRDAGLPRDALMATPAIFEKDTLIAAPVAGLKNGWRAHIVADFHSTLHGH
ncbi:MAG: tRNA lysidine(34) synthetase TilS [Pseudomonadota bacterium]